MSKQTGSEEQKTAYPARKSSWKLALAAVFIFICGIVVGTGGTLILIKHTIMTSIANPAKSIEKAGLRLKKKLDLKDDQFEQVEAILSNRMVILMKIRLDTRTEVARQLHLFRQEITPILDEGQARKFEVIFKRICRTFPEPLDLDISPGSVNESQDQPEEPSGTAPGHEQQ